MFNLSTDCSSEQKPAAPPLFPALQAEDDGSSCSVRSASTPKDKPSSHQSICTPLHSPSPITASSPATPSTVVSYSQTNGTGELNKPPNFPKLTAEKMELCPQGTTTSHGAAMETNSETAELKTTCHGATPPSETTSLGTPSVPAAQLPQTRRALFNPSNLPVRRAKRDGHAGIDGALAQSAVPEVLTDATMNDRIWRKLEPGSHRDSMSSSSSISSNDTVIDLSLPNLTGKTLSALPNPSTYREPPWVTRRRSALGSCDTLRVTKSKSNPNLQQNNCSVEEFKPRPLHPDQEGSLAQRRHTWCRLYMEGLKQASPKRPSTAAPTSATGSLMSKSLGDLTSDDISCNFDSKYRSISRSFIVRSSRDQLRKGGLLKSRPQSDLTEQLRKLTDVEPLNPGDFATENRPKDSPEDGPDETLVRRTSSRSQSRVRYIANRARKAQERQRLQSLIQGQSASFSHTGSIGSSPIEERGNPEGACSVAHSPCSSLDLLSQLSPPEPPPGPDSENSELFFMLKL